MCDSWQHRSPRPLPLSPGLVARQRRRLAREGGCRSRTLGFLPQRKREEETSTVLCESTSGAVSKSRQRSMGLQLFLASDEPINRIWNRPGKITTLPPRECRKLRFQSEDNIHQTKQRCDFLLLKIIFVRKMGERKRESQFPSLLPKYNIRSWATPKPGVQKSIWACMGDRGSDTWAITCPAGTWTQVLSY